METTCGIFLFTRKNKLLVGHVTNTRDRWSIPKGLPDPGEPMMEAAKRELIEESNVKYESLNVVKLVQNNTKTYKNKKKCLYSVSVFTNNGSKDFDLKCNSMVEGKGEPFPEIDDFRFVTVEEALKMDIQETQKEVLRDLIKDGIIQV